MDLAFALFATCIIGIFTTIYLWYKYGTVEEPPKKYTDFTKVGLDGKSKKNKKRKKKSGGNQPLKQKFSTAPPKRKKISGVPRAKSLWTCLRGNVDKPVSVHWSPDGTKLMIFDVEGVVRIWWDFFDKKDTLGKTGQFKPDGMPTGACFISDNRIAVMDAMNSVMAHYDFSISKNKGIEATKVGSHRMDYVPLEKKGVWPQLVPGEHRQLGKWILLQDTNTTDILLISATGGQLGKQKVKQLKNYMIGKTSDSSMVFLTTYQFVNIFYVKAGRHGCLQKLDVGRLEGTKQPKCAYFSPNGEEIVTCCNNGTVQVFKGNVRWLDKEKCPKLKDFKISDDPFDTICCNDKGIIAVSHGNALSFYNLRAGDEAVLLDTAGNAASLKDSRILFLKVSPDGKWIASLGSDKNLKVWKFPKA